MGICMSKGDCNQLSYSAEYDSGGHLELEPASSAARSLSNRELCSYNLYFDEWGARFLESGSRRWRVIHTPETATFSLQVEERGKIDHSVGQPQLYCKEVYVDLSFSSQLSSPLMDTQASCLLSTVPVFNPLQSAPGLRADYIPPDMASDLSLEIAEKHVLKAYISPRSNSSWLTESSLLQGSRNLNLASKIDQGGRLRIPVLTIERTQHTKGTIFFKIRECLDASHVEAECARGSSVAMSKAGAVASSSTDEIGVFNAEKYFKASTDQHEVNDEQLVSTANLLYMGERGPATTSASSSAHGPEAHDAASVYQDYRNSTAASSDMSYDSRSALSGARKLASSDAMWSTSSANNSKKYNRRKTTRPPSHDKNGSKGCLWSCYSSADTLQDEGRFARPKRRSVKVQDSVKLDSLCSSPRVTATATVAASTTRKMASPVLSTSGSEIVDGPPQRPSSSSQGLMNLFRKPKTGRCSVSNTHSEQKSTRLQKSWVSEHLFIKEHGNVDSLMQSVSGFSSASYTSAESSMDTDITVELKEHAVGSLPVLLSEGQQHGQSLHVFHSMKAQPHMEAPYPNTSAGFDLVMDTFVHPPPSAAQGESSQLSRQSLSPQLKLLSAIPLPQSRADADADAAAAMPNVARKNMSQMVIALASSSAFPHCQVATQSLSINTSTAIPEAAALKESATMAPCPKVDVKIERMVNHYHDHELQVQYNHKSNKQVTVQKRSECFAFPDLAGCMPSANPSMKGQTQTIVSCNNEEQEIPKVHSLEEMRHLEASTTVWNKEIEVMEKASRSSSISGCSTPPSSSGGLGSAFGSPFSVALSCPSSDFRTQHDFVKRLGLYSQHSHGCRMQPTSINLDDYGMSHSLPLNEKVDEYQLNVGAMKLEAIHCNSPSTYPAGTTVVDVDDDDGGLSVPWHEDAIEHRYVAGVDRLACLCEELWIKEDYHDINSDSSSDLFDLDSLAGRADGADGGLPVFEVRKNPMCLQSDL